MEISRWGSGRESVILKGTRQIDPELQLEKALSDRRGADVETSDGVGEGKRRGEREKGKGRVVEKGSETEPRGTEVAAVGGGHGDTPAASEGAGFSTYNDVHSENGESARPKLEDHYGFLHSISEADRH